MRDMRTQEMRAGKMPIQERHVKGDHGKDMKDAERRSHHVDRRGAGRPSGILEPGEKVDHHEDVYEFGRQPRYGATSSHLPNRRDTRDLGRRDQHDFNTRRGAGSSRIPDPYNHVSKHEYGDDSGYQSQSGARSSQGLVISDEDEQGLEEQLLRLRRLDLLGSLNQPRPHGREKETEGNHDFSRRQSERRFHIPGAFVTDGSEDEEIFNVRSRVGPASSTQPSPTVYGEDDPEAHLSLLRRLESLRHSYSAPVDRSQRAANTTRPAQETYAGGIQYRHVQAPELDGREISWRELDEHRTDEREIRTHHFSNHRRGLDPHNYGNGSRDDHEFTYQPRGEMRPSRRHSHRGAPNSPQDERSDQNQRTQTSRRPAPDFQPAKAHPRRHSMQSRQEELPHGRHHDDLNSRYSQPSNPVQRPDNIRRSASRSRSTEADPRPYSKSSHWGEPTRRNLNNTPSHAFSQRVSQSRRPNDSRHPVSTSRSTTSTIPHPRPQPRAPRQEELPLRTRHDASHLSYDQRSQTQRPITSRHAPPTSHPAPAHPHPHPSRPQRSSSFQPHPHTQAPTRSSRDPGGRRYLP